MLRRNLTGPIFELPWRIGQYGPKLQFRKFIGKVSPRFCRLYVQSDILIMRTVYVERLSQHESWVKLIETGGEL